MQLTQGSKMGTTKDHLLEWIKQITNRLHHGKKGLKACERQ